MIPKVVEDGQLVGGAEVVGVGELVGVDVGDLNYQDLKVQTPGLAATPDLNKECDNSVLFERGGDGTDRDSAESEDGALHVGEPGESGEQFMAVQGIIESMSERAEQQDTVEWVNPLASS